MMSPDINTSGPANIYNHSAINKDQLLAEINAREVVALYPVIFFYAAILVIGLIGNTLVLLVYSYRYKRSPARLYILFLAAIDFSICLFGLPYHLIDLTHPYTFTNSTLCKSLTFVVTTLFHMSIFGLIVIAVDRYLKICRPLNKLNVSYLGRRRACVVAIVCAIALSWPQIVLYGPSEMETPIDNLTGYACFIETQYFATSYPFAYIMSTMIICIGSTVFLILAYSLICRQIFIRYRNEFIQIRNSANDLEDAPTDDISLKSYTPSINGKYKIGTSPLAKSLESIHRKNSNNSTNSEMKETDRHSSSTKPDVIPSEQSNINNESKHHALSRNMYSLTNVDSVQNTETCKLLPDKPDQRLDSNYGNRLCVTRQRSFSLDSFEFKTPLKPEDTYVRFDKRDHGLKSKTTEDDDAVYKECRANGTNNKHVNSTSAQSSANSSTHQLYPTSIDKLFGDVNTADHSKIIRLELPKTRCRHLSNDDALKRRHSETLGNRNHIACRNNRSRSMVISGLITSTHFGDGLRIHTSSNSFAKSSFNSTKPPKLPSRKHSKITKIMLTITSVFILSYAPALVITIYTFIRPEIWDTMTEFQTVISEFFLRFYLVNNICNPFIYGFWDKRFKREIVITLKKIFRFNQFCVKCYDRKPSDSLWKAHV